MRLPPDDPSVQQIIEPADQPKQAEVDLNELLQPDPNEREASHLAQIAIPRA